MNWYKRAQQKKDPALQAILDKWRNQGVNLYVFSGDKIILDTLIVPKGQRKQGIGTAVMQDLIGYADSIGKRLELSPGIKDSYHGTTSRRRLINFYKRFGFLENKGRNKDYSTSKGMYREPQAVEQPLQAPQIQQENTYSSRRNNWYERHKLSQTYQDIIDNPDIYSNPDDPEHYNANLYFSIGQNADDDEESYCWIWNGREMRTRRGGTHALNFPDLFNNNTRENPNIYRGWADPSQELISVVMPREIGNTDVPLGSSSLPTKLKVILGDYWPGYNIKVF